MIPIDVSQASSPCSDENFPPFLSIQKQSQSRLFTLSLRSLCRIKSCSQCDPASAILSRQRPYHVENTGSRPITEVKQHRA
jgi:hypothetical protein